VNVPSSVKEIPNHAFTNCQSLVEVGVSEGLERMEQSAFEHCENLKHINKLPSTLKVIGDCAFQG
jgi:hypothetical protein